MSDAVSTLVERVIYAAWVSFGGPTRLDPACLHANQVDPRDTRWLRWLYKGAIEPVELVLLLRSVTQMLLLGILALT